MKETWALLSDVHGELRALERALRTSEQLGASRMAFLGDALGTDQDEACCRLLMLRADLAVFGNRELRLRLSLPEDVRAWLRSLPSTAILDDALLCHSSPTSRLPVGIRASEAIERRRETSYFERFPYVSGPRAAHQAAERLQELGLRTAFHGHTHRQTAWREHGDRVERVGEPEFRLDAGTTIVGVGSVGRAGGGKVEFGIYSPAERRVRLVSADLE